MEARIAELEDELEEEVNNSELFAEKARKQALQVEQLTADLNAERSNLQKAENARMALERSNKEMKAKLSEMEAQMRTRSKATIASLESKIGNLEEQLDMEARERQALARANRKMDKKMREMLLQVEEERRHADQYKEQVRNHSNPHTQFVGVCLRVRVCTIMCVCGRLTR